jgi:hypothetical protein
MLVQWSDEKKILMALAPQHSEPLRAAVPEAA